MFLPSPQSLRPACEEDRKTVTRLFANASLGVTCFDWAQWKQTVSPLLTLLVSDSHGQDWGTIVLQVEPRPLTLPACLQGRVYVRGLAVARGRNSRDDVRSLLLHSLDYLHNQHTEGQLILITDRTWLYKAAVQSDFQQVDSLRYLHRNLRIGEGGNPGGLVRPVKDTDYGPLACRDAETFGPLWHMGERELRQQAQTSQLLVQQMDSELAGYILFEKPQFPFRQAFVTRLAVWTEWQGRKIGSHLLMRAVAQLRKWSPDKVGLNVLESNEQAREFYAHHGFRALGRPQAVLTSQIGHSFPQA